MATQAEEPVTHAVNGDNGDILKTGYLWKQGWVMACTCIFNLEVVHANQ